MFNKTNIDNWGRRKDEQKFQIFLIGAIMFDPSNLVAMFQSLLCLLNRLEDPLFHALPRFVSRASRSLVSPCPALPTRSVWRWHNGCSKPFSFFNCLFFPINISPTTPFCSPTSCFGCATPFLWTDFMKIPGASSEAAGGSARGQLSAWLMEASDAVPQPQVYDVLLSCVETYEWVGNLSGVEESEWNGGVFAWVEDFGLFQVHALFAIDQRTWANGELMLGRWEDVVLNSWKSITNAKLSGSQYIRPVKCLSFQLSTACASFESWGSARGHRLASSLDAPGAFHFGKVLEIPSREFSEVWAMNHSARVTEMILFVAVSLEHHSD